MLVNIQLLRFLAAFCVVLYHGAAQYHAIGGSRSGDLFSFVEEFGYAGVDVFFVISGFIIWHTTREINGMRGVFDFAYRRATRIYLGYWPFFFMSALDLRFFEPDALKKVNLLGSFLLTQPLSDKLLLPITWTLRYELYFYLCFSLLLLTSRKAALKLICLSGGIVIAVQIWHVFRGHIYDPHLFDFAPELYKFYLSPYCLEFMAGCFVAHHIGNVKKTYTAITIFLASAVAIIGLALWYQDTFITGFLDKGYYALQRVLLFGTASVMLLLGALALEKRGRILLPKFSLLMGGASYSIYLSHSVLFLFMHHIGLMNALSLYGKGQFVWISLSIIVILAFSIVHYKCIERPLIAYSRKMRGLIGVIIDRRMWRLPSPR
jgi:exopolysaccharide production protein ExoZ